VVAVFVVRYDIETRRTAVRLVPALACPLCRAAGQVEMSVYQQFLTVFGGLPVAPMERFGAAYCHHCRQPIPRKADRQGLKSAFDWVVARMPRPRPLAYAGTIIVALIALVGYSGLALAMLQQKARHEAHAQMLTRIADPRPGDIELVWVTPGGVLTYTLFKVVSISGDNVTLRAHRETKSSREVTSDSVTFASFGVKDSDFSGATFVVQKSQFARQFLTKTPFERADLKDVLRPSQP
jgi:hypothetical protein